jgi:hypothetical protein
MCRMSRKRVPSSSVSPPAQMVNEPAIIAARELCVLAKVCNDAARTFEQKDLKSLIVTDRLSIIAGWTIYTASCQGVLDSVLELQSVLSPADQDALKRGTARQCSTALKVAAPGMNSSEPRPFLSKWRGPSSDLGAIQEGNTTWIIETPLFSPDQIAEQAREDAVRIQAEADAAADSASFRLINRLWSKLAEKQKDRLPAATLELFISEKCSPERSMSLRDQLVRTGFVCDLLAAWIEKRHGLPERPPLPADRRSVVASQIQLRGDVLLEQVWVAYPDLDRRQRERLKKRLAYWRDNQGGRAKVRPAVLSRKDKTTYAAERTLWPADIVVRFVTEMLRKKSC